MRYLHKKASGQRGNPCPGTDGFSTPVLSRETIVERWRHRLGMDFVELERAVEEILCYADQRVQYPSPVTTHYEPAVSSITVQLCTGQILAARLEVDCCGNAELCPLLPTAENRYMGRVKICRLEFEDKDFARRYLDDEYVYLSVLRDGLEETEDDLFVYSSAEMWGLFGKKKVVKL